MASARQSLWESGHDETVEVNQRALIDKVLARYSGEFTVFRELLQNSDDAASKAVEIHFDTQAYLDGKKKSADDGTKRPPPVNGVTQREKLPDLKTEHVHQWTFKNNGIAFRDEDWNRLKKIAEGNPDEEKIGAFGVGFYSLFSITEEPFVTSGDQWMGFYWKDKKDQLFARRGTLNTTNTSTPSAANNEWTSFEMPLREPAAIPDAFDFTRFLASSITFMVHLRSVSVFFNDKRLAHLEKDPGVPRGLGIPKCLRTKSPMATMQVASIKHTPLQIKAEVMRWVYTSGTPKPSVRKAVTRALNPTSTQSGFFHSLFSSFANPSPQHTATPSPAPPVVEETTDQLAINETSVVLAIYSAEVDVKLDKKTAQELLRSTKKNPPTTLRLDLIYTGKMEYDASKQEDDKYKNTGSIFQGLRADLDGTGSTRVFIGHATGQTTGLGGHISARFIPTVERESIDLVDRNVSMWNKELLYVGGFLARAAYELELVTVRDLWKGASESASQSTAESAAPDQQMQVWLRDRAIHALRFFTFHPSTPSATVSSLLEAGFFMAGNSGPFPIISSVGVRDAADVRIPDPAFSGFLKQLPVLPDAVVSGAQLMVDTLRARNVIKDISFTDVLAELRARPLSEVELVECLRWWIGVTKQPQQTQPSIQHIRQELVSAALLAIAPGTPNEKIIPLSTIKTFVNLRSTGAIMPLDGPFPDHTVLPSVSRPFIAADLISAFGWQELTVVEWIRHVANVPPTKSTPEFDLSVSAVWAERILNCLARAWPSVANAQQLEIVEILKNKSCVPTRSGMKLPAQAYFANANIFPDLPVVTMPNGSAVKGPLEKVLVSLGVRKHVDLQVVFDRMIKTGDWTIADLTKYLVAVQQTLTSVEMERLRQTAAFPKEVPSSPATANDAKPMTRYKASDLYEPLDVFRELKLPVIDWGEHTKWRPSSDEAKFLYGLGLRRFPPLPEILGLAANADETLRSAALRYFLKNTSRYPDYEPMNFSNLQFIPALKANGTSVMGTPKDVFVNPESAILGFNIVHPTLREAEIDQLKLRKNPPTSLIIPLLEKTPPKTHAMAQQWFGNLAGRLSEFSAAELTKLSQMPIVPAQPLAGTSEKATTQQMRMMAPKDCYFRVDSNQNFHSKLFVFVDFGAKANTFLSACGTKHEPSVEEIVQMILADPRRFYHVADGRENYLMELRNIAVNRRLISPGLRSRMMKATILLGSRRVRKGKANGIIPALLGSQDVDEEEWDFEYDLLRPDQVVIADDTNGYQFFGDSVFSAPQEDLLEDFYLDLGSPRLSSLIREDYKTSGEIKDAKISRDMRALVLERLPLFLHEHTHARTKVQYSWLNNERNFVVKTFGKLTVTKHLNFGTTRLSRNQDTSAAAKSPGYGPIELWLAGNAQVDMYEVAISLCRVLFNTPKPNDALLFMTILSTDLRALRRRGYNVDRILKQQKAERHAAEEARRKEAKDIEKLLSDYLPPGGMPPPVPVASKPMPPLPADAKAGDETPRPASPDVPPSSESDALIPESEKKGIARHPSHFVNSLQTWRKKLGSKGDTTSGEGGSSRPGSVVMNGNTRKPQQGVTPLSNIASNIDQAIAACRPERSNLLHNREQMQMVKESMEEGYCDVAGRIGDLDYIGSMADVKVYVSKDVVDGRNIMPTHRDAIARFIHVIQPLRSLYKLPPTSLHIFYDLQGDAIAFNRAASIFLNLRYYESWHDSNVVKGDLSQALISWFFTLAHEIAHNLVQPHNSEHEFWFSSICEAHVIGLGHLIAKAGKTAPKVDGVIAVQQS